MADKGMGVPCVPGMGTDAGTLDGSAVDARQLRSELGYRQIALIWRRSTPRESEFRMLAAALQRIMRDLHPASAGHEAAAPREPALQD